MSFANHVIEFVKVIASSVGGTNGAPLFNVSGVPGFALDADGQVTGDDASDEASEQAQEQEVYQALGVIGRPLPPDGDAFLEALALRTDDGLVPFAFRDMRLHRAVNPTGSGVTPRAGQLMFAGYGGAFLSHSMTEDNVGAKKGNVTVLYVPHDFNGAGVPQKAHAIIVDPSDGNSSLQLIHASGLRLTLTEDAGGGPGIVASVDGETFFRMTAGEFSVSATKILLKGNCYLGRQAETGAPMLGGAITPPSTSVFLSAV